MVGKKGLMALLLALTLCTSGCFQLAGNVDEDTGEYWFFTVTDPINATTNGTDDYLIRMVLVENKTDDFALADLSVTLTVENVTYDCGTDAAADCMLQLEGDDNLWSDTEHLNISESGVDICSSDGCGIFVLVTYSGEIIHESVEALAVD